MTGKEELRRRMKTLLRAELRGREEKSAAICEAVRRHPAWAEARTVALFDSLPTEPALESLWPAPGRRFFLPRVRGAELRLLEVEDPGRLGPAIFPGGYREPPADAPEAAEVDLILVPGLAFTSAGWRLGRGGGFYDRLLARLPARTVRLGVAFARQLLPELPLEPHDQPLHGVLTEAGLAG